MKKITFLALLFILLPYFSLVLSASNTSQSLSVNVDDYGAIGDGIHDDSSAIQNAFDSGYTVEFTKNKTYKLISNGLYIRNNLAIIGNNATLLIDDSYSPINSDFSKRIIRHSYNSYSDFLIIKNLNINVNIQKGKYALDETNYLCILQPTYIDNVQLDYVNIYVSASHNKIINLWLDKGCSNFEMNHCTLENNTTYKEGGTLWLMSSTDTQFNKYTNFENINISECTFTGTCGDELIAIYGKYSANARFDHCVIVGNNQSPNVTRPITVYSNGYNTKSSVFFSNCTISCSYDSSIKNCAYDSLLGIGSNDSSNYLDVTFSKCDITASVKNCLLYPSLIQKSINTIASFDFNTPNISINFMTCNVACNRPISGSSSMLINNASELISLGFSMTNCQVVCNYTLSFLQPIKSGTGYYYYSPHFILFNNSVHINNELGLIVSKYNNLNYSLVTNNNNYDITAFNESLILNDESIKYITQKNSKLIKSTQ